MNGRHQTEKVRRGEFLSEEKEKVTCGIRTTKGRGEEKKTWICPGGCRAVDPAELDKHMPLSPAHPRKRKDELVTGNGFDAAPPNDDGG